MSKSNIVTGQYVQISQTPASVGERMVAQLVDWVLQGVYIYCSVRLLLWVDRMNWLASWQLSVAAIVGITLPVMFYCPLYELLNKGQTVGKLLLRIRVVKSDGTAPTIGSALMRWLLFIVDGPSLGPIGLLVMLISKNTQRLGDMAAGTMVVKLDGYSRLQVSLDEFSHLSRNYRPTYPHAEDLSLEQVNLISETLELADDDPRVHALAQKVMERFGIARYQESSDAMFLWRVVKDYQYFALEAV